MNSVRKKRGTTRVEWKNGIHLDRFRFSAETNEKRSRQSGRRTSNCPASKIVVSQEGQVAAVGQPDKGIWIYDVTNNRELKQLTFQALPETEHSSLAFTANGRLIAFAKTNNSVTVQDTADRTRAVHGRYRLQRNSSTREFQWHWTVSSNSD
jgi:WD40 repeat protein